MATIMNNWVDIHNHSLPTVDDGASSINEAVENLKILKELGFQEIVLTSHYVMDSKYQANVKKRTKILKDLEKSCENLGLKLYLGNEVFVADAEVLLEKLAKKEIATLNNSKYLLLELPMHHKINSLEQIVCELNSNGIIPIIAHPERYDFVREDIEYLKILLEYDCYLQVNLGSLIGKYGKSARKLAINLLKKDMVHFVATDAHHLKSESEFKKALKVLNRKVSEEKSIELLRDNPKKVIENKNLSLEFNKV